MGSMKVPTLSPSKRGYDVATITTTWRVGFEPGAAEQQPPRNEERFETTLRRELRLPLAALDEDDRDLANSRSRAGRPRTASRPETRSHPRRNAGAAARECLAPPAPIAARAVSRRKARHGADVSVGERAQDDAVQRPVHHADPVQVARADHESWVGGAAISAGRYAGLCDRSASIWQIRSASGLRAPLQAVDVRAAETARTCAVHHVDAAGELARELVGHGARAVRRRVVDDQQR